MTYIEPLELETWFVNVFSGSLEMFSAISLIVLSSVMGYFRLPMVSFFFLMIIYLIMFSQWVSGDIYYLILPIGAALAGYWISRIVKN